MAYFTQYIHIEDDFRHNDGGEDEYICTLLHYTPGMMRAAEIDSVRIPATKRHRELSYEENVYIYKRAIEMLQEKRPDIWIHVD